MGAGLIAAIGAVDDATDLAARAQAPRTRPRPRSLPVVFDVRVENVTLPFIGAAGTSGRSGAAALTVLGMVAVMNIVNFTDGVDGLAAGVCTIAALTFAVIALSLYRTDAGVLAAITAGAAIGFLWHNLHPACVFMGDSGANLLGLLLACVAVQGVLKTAAVVALVFPLVILAVPILDTGFVVAKRIKYRRPVYSADRWHFHHRFANIGFSQRRTVALPVRLDARPRGARARAALRALLGRPRHLRPRVDARAGAGSACWRSRRASTSSTCSRSSSSGASANASSAGARADGRRADAAEIDEEIAREVETGEFEAVGRE